MKKKSAKKVEKETEIGFRGFIVASFSLVLGIITAFSGVELMFIENGFVPGLSLFIAAPLFFSAGLLLLFKKKTRRNILAMLLIISGLMLTIFGMEIRNKTDEILLGMLLIALGLVISGASIYLVTRQEERSKNK